MLSRLEISLMSAIWLWQQVLIPAWLYRLLLFAGNAIPKTSAPMRASQSVNQLPLKPVCPVTSTRFPFQKEAWGARFIPRPSKVDSPYSIVLPANFSRAGYPSVARNHHADRPLTVPSPQADSGALLPNCPCLH